MITFSAWQIIEDDRWTERLFERERHALWVSANTLTDAPLRVRIANNPETDLAATVERALNRELDRLALMKAERPRVEEPSSAMWSIIVSR